MERRTRVSTLRHVSARSRWLLSMGAAAVVAVVVFAVIVVVSVVRGGNATTQPPVLHLSSVAVGSAGLPAQSAAGISNNGGAPDRSPSGSGWRLEGTLPGGPSFRRVNFLPAGAATRAFVSTLARALGMSGAPALDRRLVPRLGHHRTVRVRAGGPALDLQQPRLHRRGGARAGDR